MVKCHEQAFLLSIKSLSSSDLGIGSELTCKFPKELSDFEELQDQGKYSEIPQFLS